jgi:pSer/pThr/pTyr-binding forkhead associated (FHA) protein
MVVKGKVVRQMESICPICKKPYDGVVCTQCTVTDLDVSGLMASEGLHVEAIEKEDDGATAFLVDLVSNRKIPITTPRCKVGRDDLNDIVISGDQSISRFHFVISKENNQYLVQDGKSRHGTFLNGNQITAPEPIHDGDVLKVGVSLFWFVIENVAAGAEPDKTSPVAVGGDEAELEFGAPEPNLNRFMSASATQTNLPRAELSETGAFPALDLGRDLLHAPQDVQVRGAGSRDAVQEFAPEAHSSEMSAEDLNDSAHSYRSPLDSSKVIDNFAGDDEAPEYENLTFFEPIGSESLTGSGSAEEVATVSETKEEPVASSDAVSENEITAEESSDKPEAVEEDFQPTHHNAFENLLDSHFSVESHAASVETPILQPVESVAEDEDEDESEVEEAAEKVEEVHELVAAPLEEPESVQSEFVLETVVASDAESPSSPTTLERLAEAVEEAGSLNAPIASKDSSTLAQMISDAYTNQLGEPTSGEHENGDSENKHTSNGAKSLMSTTKESLSGTVPDWCNRYFHGELSRLGKELTDLNDQVRAAQQKIKEVEGRVSLTKGLRNTLLTSQGEDLVEGCGRVLSLLGWRVRISDEDKHELRVETDEKHTCIARVVWTETQADRTHLGQLSISQTRYWCEQGIEPKGILIVSRNGENGPHALTSSDFNSELADYASKKNVCLMTTLQLLAIFKDIALHEGSMEAARNTIMASNGWLPGFALEPSDEEKESSSTNKLSSLLSA